MSGPTKAELLEQIDDLNAELRKANKVLGENNLLPKEPTFMDHIDILETETKERVAAMIKDCEALTGRELSNPLEFRCEGASVDLGIVIHGGPCEPTPDELGSLTNFALTLGAKAAGGSYSFRDSNAFVSWAREKLRRGFIEGKKAKNRRR